MDKVIKQEYAMTEEERLLKEAQDAEDKVSINSIFFLWF